MRATATALQATGKGSANSEVFSSPEKRNAIVCLLLVAATLLVYNSVNRNPFINCDDDRYITENPHIRAGLNWDTVKWALTSTGQGGFWHPLTWMSHALDIQLFRFNPAGHHFVSLLIHCCNVVLVFLLLVWATKRWATSLLVAALFALHPLNVESVAWAAERKNVLSAFFFLAAVAAYGWYALHPNWKRYLAVAGLFTCSLASKPMAVTFPCALLLLDYWPLGRTRDSDADAALPTKRASWKELTIEKIPLVLLSTATSIVTFVAQKAAGATRSTGQFSLAVRLENAIVAYATYVWKMLWPTRLTPVYPHPGGALPLWQIGVSALFLLCISVFVLLKRRGYLLVGWFWFLGILFPTIGLVQVGDQAMADRFAYVPEIGFLVMVVWALADLLNGYKVSMVWRSIPAVAVLVALALLTYRQIGYWHSSYDLWLHAVAVTRNNFIAEDNLGGALILEGKEEEAHPHFEAAAQINPNDPMSRSNLGTYYQTHNQMREAVAQYEAAVKLTSDPGLLAQTYANLGAAYRALGQDLQADYAFEHALHLNPNQFNAWLGRGLLERKEGHLEEAIRDLSRSVELRPTPEAYFELGRTLTQAGRTPQALDAYQQALQLSPNFIEAQQALATLRRQQQ